MSQRQIPRQPKFDIDKEDWGHILLEDGTTIDLRFILVDLIVTGEDLLGPQIVIGHVVGIRARATSETMMKVKDKPFAPDVALPLTKEAGWEPIEVKTVEKPVKSSYFFEEYFVVVELSLSTVIRNMQYRMPSGSPVYSVRWNVRHTLSKATTQSRTK